MMNEIVRPRQFANVRAEEAVIGKIITDGNAYRQIASDLCAEHFTLPHHRAIFTAVADCCETSAGPSISLLESKLPEEFEGVGSVEAVLQILIEKASDVTSPTDFVDDILSAWRERQRALATTPRSLAILTPVQWQDLVVPKREWAVDGLMPQRNVTLFGANGGDGKTLLSLQLQVAAARAKPWLGVEVEPMRSFGLYCEDDEDELHRRMIDIAAHYECRLSELDDVSLISRVGEDNLLVEFNPRTDIARPTALYHSIGDHAAKSGVRLIVLDSLHDLFAGNEISRSHTRQFISFLRKLAIRINGTVLLNAHPSLAGINFRDWLQWFYRLEQRRAIQAVSHPIK